MVKRSLRLIWRGLGHVTRVTIGTTVMLAFLGACGIFYLRMWVLPDIERYHDEITQAASYAVGQKVKIGKIEADWRGFRPHLLFADVRVLDQEGETALFLPRVDNSISWMSLFTGQLRLYRLEIDRPDLLIKRDEQGKLFIAGVPLSNEASDNDLSDWLLHQHRIVVRDARITWQDDVRKVPALTLNKVNLRIENSRDTHRFAVRALPPRKLSSEIDVRGDFVGDSFDDLSEWRGQLFAQIDHADVGALRTWAPLPQSLKSGQGGMRVWLGVEQGHVVQMTGDLALSDVVTRLADDLPPLDAHAMRGRLTWRDVNNSLEVSTRNFSLQLHNGLSLKPTDFYLRLNGMQNKVPSGGELRANVLELPTLVTLTDFLPLDRDLKKQLGEFAPQGRVEHLEGKWELKDNALKNFDIKAKFQNLALRKVGSFPGISGLTGDIEGNEEKGALAVNTRNLAVDAPAYLREPLRFDAFTVQADWEKTRKGWTVNVSNASVSNGDAAGNAYGSYSNIGEGPGKLDLTVQLNRANVHATAKYIPLGVIGKGAHDWLASGLVGGVSSDFKLRLNGDLRDFPFDGGKGSFEIHAHAKEVVIDYGKDWPRVEHGNAELLIRGRRLEVNAESAMLAGGHVRKVNVALPDMLSPDLHLEIRGEAEGESVHCLNYVQDSPVRGYIDGFTDEASIQGDGLLKLFVDVPLLGESKLKVDGTYQFRDNDVDLGGGIPKLYGVNGELHFTESSVETHGMKARVLGGPATIQVSGSVSGLQAKAEGRIDVEELRKTDSTPILHRLHGGTPWEADISVQNKAATVLISSTLVGLASDLPRPFNKAAHEPMPLRIEKASTGAGQDLVTAHLGNLFSARFQRVQADGEWGIRKGAVNFGNAGKWPDKEGLWLVGTLPELELSGWQGVGGAGGDTGSLQIAGTDLLIQKLSFNNAGFDDVRVNAHSQQGGLAAQIAAKGVSGDLLWIPQGQGKLLARFRALAVNKLPTAQKPVMQASPQPTGEMPALDVQVEHLVFDGKQVGRLDMKARQQGAEWLLENLHVVNPDAALSVNGKWRRIPNAEQTQANIKLEVFDAGKILDRSGYPNSVKNGSGTLEGTLTWAGDPGAFSFAATEGALKLDGGKGRFMKIEPGIGKLLGILSLQALPKRITLDFNDVFSDGFEFDSMAGTAQIKQGLLTTNDFKIDGSSAAVTMHGQVDLVRETQNLRIRVMPAVGDSVSILGAVALNPVIGLGAYIANKVLRNPLDKLVSFEYNVTGAWDNPHVEKVGQAKRAAPEENN
jgi:uncharacterized protein (TIGR02099 family)